MTWAACGFSVFTENWSSWKEGWCSSRLPPAFEVRHQRHTFSLLKGPSGVRVLSSPAHLYQEETRKIHQCQSDLHTGSELCMFCSFTFNGRIIALQCCVGFCHTPMWISHRHTYVPALLNLPPTPSHPSSLPQSTRLSSLC